MADRVKELIEAMTKLKGPQRSWRSLFTEYDNNHDGLIDRSELSKLLKKAGIGGFGTRGLWVDGIMEKADEQLNTVDEKVSWPEFQSMIGGTPTASVRRKLRTMYGYV